MSPAGASPKPGRMQACRICGNRVGNRWHVAREMMLGLRDTFEYLECGRCGCLQIAEVPADLDRYYPDTFGSLRPVSDRSPAPWTRWLRRRRTRYALGDPVFMGRAARRLLRRSRSGIWGNPDPYTWLRRCGAHLDSRLLDVGCGTGSLLLALRDDGFAALAGADPMLPRALAYSGGLRVHNGSFTDLPGPFDILMFHHSFEHVRDPLATLRAARRRLAPGGWLIVRMPVAGCHAWREYGVDWVQLDAPRHLHIHTPRSLEHLAQQAGLRVVDVEWDSFSVQFWGSEQYRLDIPLTDPRSFLVARRAAPFGREQIESWEARSRQLNALKDGDSACFYLRSSDCATRH